MPDLSGNDLAAPERNERLEVARRLHDGPAQRLVALGFELDALIAETDLAPHLKSRIRELRLEVSSISGSFRDEIYLLRQIPFAKVTSLVTKVLPQAQVEISLPLSVFTLEVEDKISSVILEIARNSARHSSATLFQIAHNLSDHVDIRIIDNGRGSIAPKERSFGLKMITEVISALGGEISWTSDGSGSEFRIRLAMP